MWYVIAFSLLTLNWDILVSHFNYYCIKIASLTDEIAQFKQECWIEAKKVNSKEQCFSKLKRIVVFKVLEWVSIYLFAIIQKIPHRLQNNNHCITVYYRITMYYRITTIVLQGLCLWGWSLLIETIRESLEGFRFYISVNDYSCFPITSVFFLCFHYVTYLQVPVTWKEHVSCYVNFLYAWVCCKRGLSYSNLFYVFYFLNFLERMKGPLWNVEFSSENGVRSWQSLTGNTAEWEIQLQVEYKLSID